MGQVVDVFGGAGEVDEFADGFQLGLPCNFFLEVVLDRFHVMVGGALDGFDPQGICFAKVAEDAFQKGIGCRGKSGHFTDLRVCRQHLQPADFYQYAVVDQAIFAEPRA